MDRISDEWLDSEIDYMSKVNQADESTCYDRYISALVELRERRKADKVDEPVLIDCDYCKRRHDQRIACHAYLQSGHGE